MVPASKVKELRERTGAPMMDCKRALEDTGGDMERAQVLLRERGQLKAEKKAGRTAQEGLVESYIHLSGRIGALVELNCETDFVANTGDFHNLAHDVAMQVAAANPRWVSPEDVPAAELEAERETLRRQAEAENPGKPAAIVDRIVEGRLKKFYERECLLQQPFIKNPDITVEQLVKDAIARLGEQIVVRRFARFERGETGR